MKRHEIYSFQADFKFSPMAIFKMLPEKGIINVVIGDLKGKLESSWNKYIKNPDIHKFPPDIFSHNLFNLTGNIYKNTEFFVRAVIESQVKGTDKSFLDFTKLYPSILSPIRMQVEYNSFFEKLFFACRYGEELELFDFKVKKKCSLFHTSLTNNGICYSFNGEKFSDSFMSSKIVNTLKKITTEDYPNIMFNGSGFHDGI